MTPSENSPRDYRAALDKLRANEPQESGALLGGLSADDAIVIASFQNPYVCRRFRRELSAAGISSTVVRQRGKTAVEVKTRDRETAWQVLAKQRLEYPDQLVKRTRRAFDFTLLTGLLGSIVGLSAVVLSADLVTRIALWSSFTLTGILLGYLADRLMRSLRYQGRLQIQIKDFLVLVLIAGVLLGVWTFILPLLG